MDDDIANPSADAAEDKVLDDAFDGPDVEEVEKPETLEVPEEEESKEEPEEPEEPEKEVEEEEVEEPAEFDDLDHPIPGRPKISEITAKYPALFKDFPELRHAFFREQEFSKVYATVNQAREAAEQAQTFKVLEDSLTAGDPTLLVQSLAQTDKKALRTFAHQVMLKVAAVDPGVFREVNTRLIKGVLRTALEEARSAKNENLFNGIQHLSAFLFKDPNVTPVSEPLPEPEKKQQSIDPRFPDYHEEVKEMMGQELNKVLEASVPKSITGLQRKTAVNELRERLQNMMTSDSDYRRRIQALWDEVEKRGFPRHDKPRLVAAFLGRVKSLVPHARAKVLAEAGITAKPKPKVIPSSSVGARMGAVDPKKVDYRHTSDDDILDGKFKLKR